MVKINQFAKYPGQMSFSWKVTVSTHRHTHTHTHRIDCCTWTTIVACLSITITTLFHKKHGSTFVIITLEKLV